MICQPTLLLTLINLKIQSKQAPPSQLQNLYKVNLSSLRLQLIRLGLAREATRDNKHCMDFVRIQISKKILKDQYLQSEKLDFQQPDNQFKDNLDQYLQNSTSKMSVRIKENERYLNNRLVRRIKEQNLNMTIKKIYIFNRNQNIHSN